WRGDAAGSASPPPRRAPARRSAACVRERAPASPSLDWGLRPFVDCPLPLAHRLMAGQRILVPSVGVRVPVGQPQAGSAGAPVARLVARAPRWGAGAAPR